MLFAGREVLSPPRLEASTFDLEEEEEEEDKLGCGYAMRSLSSVEMVEMRF